MKRLGREGAESGSGCDSAAPTLIAPQGRGGGERGASRPLALAPTAFPCALQETYKLPHRLIEKKRRDRINECIAQLKDLLPEHLKLTVSEKLAPLQASSSTQRAGGGHSPPPAGPTGNCRPDGRRGAGGWLCFGVPFPPALGFFWQPHANEVRTAWTSPSWLQHQLAFVFKSLSLSFLVIFRVL